MVRSFGSGSILTIGAGSGTNNIAGASRDVVTAIGAAVTGLSSAKMIGRSNLAKPPPGGFVLLQAPWGIGVRVR
jgi:hypothetical protein